MKRFSVIITLLGCVGCGQLEPTRVQTYGFDEVLAGLDWRTIAPGCVARWPVPRVETRQATYVQRTDDGRLMVTYRLDADHTLTVEFHTVDGVWRLCEWDTTNN